MHEGATPYTMRVTCMLVTTHMYAHTSVHAPLLHIYHSLRSLANDLSSSSSGCVLTALRYATLVAVHPSSSSVVHISLDVQVAVAMHTYASFLAQRQRQHRLATLARSTQGWYCRLASLAQGQLHTSRACRPLGDLNQYQILKH